MLNTLILSTIEKVDKYLDEVLNMDDSYIINVIDIISKEENYN